MKKFDVIIALESVQSAKREWAAGVTMFNASVDTLMSRLLHEAAANYMSPEEVARASGFTPKRVRQMMRDRGLNPRDGKTVLNQKASEALANNAALLGIEPSEMDLMSPLAYLPMGEKMKRELQDKTVSQVHEVSGNDHHASKAKIIASLHMGIDAEENWDGPSVKPGDLTDAQIEWVAAWLVGDGVTA